MGKFLRPMLGRDLVIIGGTSGAVPRGKLLQADPASFDASLARVAIPRFMLDLRPARDNQAVFGWLSEPRSMHANIGTFVTTTPAVAFDALYFVDNLTPARAQKP